jgi:hypothetical protein
MLIAHENVKAVSAAEGNYGFIVEECQVICGERRPEACEERQASGARLYV